jgi:hypothetical protein
MPCPPLLSRSDDFRACAQELQRVGKLWLTQSAPLRLSRLGLRSGAASGGNFRHLGTSRAEGGNPLARGRQIGAHDLVV